ncbi:protein-methionine-sulfoxide reductase heme-binding subunit MsrQ [Candidimonas nitroreducens]|uniref:sulfite oxidase heme-binding subunit YedZ n=1 Tax=Candidimonas nitroreducens TaxID=683354 RepID=UPI001303E9B2|nr:protein-methionine-sulfoxide reductase heme-binding subunit MsrQ [Candidimonas nitroreducens]
MESRDRKSDSGRQGQPPIGVPQRRSKSGYAHYALSLCVHLFGLFPLARWLVLGYLGGLTANPQEFLIRSSGTWALALLWATLAVTPIRRLSGWAGLVRHRRKLGLYAFFYTVLHVIAWALWDRGGVPASMWADLWLRDFIGIGALAVLCLVPLAVTSTHGWMRRLGRWWTYLHWLVYPAAILSVWHFDWMRAGKNDFFEPHLYAWALAVLLGVRIVWWARQHHR